MNRPSAREKFGLVLAAAGSSTRFGGGASKVILALDGVPILVRAARPFRAAFGDLAIAVATRAQDRAAVAALAREHDALSGAVVLEGGATRQESVSRALAALPRSVDVVLVHDAARPLVTSDLVRRVAEAAARDGAAAPALPLTDSVHRADAAGRLVESFARDALRTVQTPQAARADLLRQAFDYAVSRGLSATDEVALLIAAGVPVTAVPGDPGNLKVTTPDDLAAALAILKRGG